MKRSLNDVNAIDFRFGLKAWLCWKTLFICNLYELGQNLSKAQGRELNFGIKAASWRKMT